MMFFSLYSFISCTEDIPKDEIYDKPEEDVKVSPITDLAANDTGKIGEIKLTWTYPADVTSVEISYQLQNDNSELIKSIVRKTSGDKGSFLINVREFGVYVINVVAMNNYGKRSEHVTLLASPSSEEEGDKTSFIQKADLLMSSVMDLYFGKSPRDCWNSTYPNASGPYWNGDATVWGQGSGLSGFVALRKASLETEYEQKYTTLTDRMYNSINRFITTDNDIHAYAVYPQNGNDRFYDDNVWIGLDMVDLYIQTQEDRFIEKAVLVWDYLMHGKNDEAGGGILWREKPAYSKKHTCSTAPTVVLGCKLYEITKDPKYLDTAKELYDWLKKYMQDPNDYLFYDNISPEFVVDKAKYSYNSGQPLQAACLLYNITSEDKYFTDAVQIAYSAYNRWFTLYDSKELGEKFYRINGDHTWFYAILFRGFFELYKIDNRRVYIDAFEKSMLQIWQSEGRNSNTNLLNNMYFINQAQSKWDILHEGAFVEILSQLANLEK